MAAPFVNRSPTCLSCLRRLASPSTSGLSGPLPAATTYIQVRGKKKIPRSEIQRVVVRLLEDVPKFGRKHAIIPVERGRMRNLWYPAQRAEYMTAGRFRELGLTREDVGERDFVFGTAAPSAADIDVPEEDRVPAVEVETLAPARAQALLSFIVPSTLTFTRKAIQTPSAKREQPRSPLLDPSASLSTPASSDSEPAPVEGGKSGKTSSTTPAIFGSVSTTDIITSIKELLTTDPEASRITIGPENIRFPGLEDAADRVKTLGRWDIEISVNDEGSSSVGPIQRTVEVIAEE